jgi:hypothetical protein
MCNNRWRSLKLKHRIAAVISEIGTSANYRLLMLMLIEANWRADELGDRLGYWMRLPD